MVGGGGAVKTIEKSCEKAGMEIVYPLLAVQWVPDQDEIQKCFEFGREFAKKVVLD